MALLWRLAREMAAGLPGFALALAVLLWPGLVVRGVTIGNTPLELVLTTGFVLALWRAHRSASRRPLIVAAAVLGLGLLTKLTMLGLVPAFLVVLALRARSGAGALKTLSIGLIPVAIVAPWLIGNLARYGALFSVDIAGGAGVGSVAPGVGARLNALGPLEVRLIQGVLPQEFLRQYPVRWIHHSIWVGVLVFAGLALAALIVHRRDARVWLLAAPFLGGFALMHVAYVFTGNNAFILRYLYPTLPALALAASFAIPRRVPVAAVYTAWAFALWIDMAGAFYFTDLGAKLGI